MITFFQQYEILFLLLLLLLNNLQRGIGRERRRCYTTRDATTFIRERLLQGHVPLVLQLKCAARGFQRRILNEQRDCCTFVDELRIHHVLGQSRHD